MITVSPRTYTKVQFDANEIEGLAAASLARVPALDPTVDVAIEIDEVAATSRVKITSTEPVRFAVESGALQQYPAPRTLGSAECDVTFTRLFLELADRLSPEFQAPPIDDVPTHAERMAWDVNLYGRVNRLGPRVHTPRHRYNFRNRHGFSDLADRTFDQLWSSDDLNWPEIRRLSAQALDPIIT